MAATQVTTLSGEDLPGLIECILRQGYKRNESIVEHAQHLNWSERSALQAERSGQYYQRLFLFFSLSSSPSL